MHYLISKALRYDPCLTRDHTVLPATHTRTIPAFTPQPQGITALRPVPSYTAWWTEAHLGVRNLPRFLRRVPGRDANPRPLDGKSDTLPTASRRARVVGVKRTVQKMSIVQQWAKIAMNHVNKHGTTARTVRPAQCHVPWFESFHTKSQFWKWQWCCTIIFDIVNVFMS